VAARQALLGALPDFTTCAATSFDEAVKSFGAFHICEAACVLELFASER